MFVLQINSYFAGSVFYEDLYTAIERHGIQEDVYVFTHVNNELDQKYNENVKLRHPYYHFDRFLFPLKHRKVFTDLERTFDLNRYSIAHAHSLFSNGYITLLLKRKYGIPYVVTVRNADINVFFKWAFFLRKLGNQILKNAEKVVFLSQAHCEETLEKYVDKGAKEEIRRKSILIPNGVNRFWFEHANHDRPNPGFRPLRLLYVGNVDKNKNLMTTMRACDELIRRGIDVRYNVAGRVRDEHVAAVLRKYPYARYHPFMSDKENLLQLYRENDIYVMPSKYETFGISYVEAMSQGLPVIYTRGQGFDTHFQDGEVGYSVQYDDPIEIADRIEEIMKNYPGISKNASEKVVRFDWNRIGSIYADLYRSVSEGSEGGRS